MALGRLRTGLYATVGNRQKMPVKQIIKTPSLCIFWLSKPNAWVVTSQSVLWRHTSSNAKIINTHSSLLFSQIMAEIDIWVRFFPSAQIQHQVAGPLLGFSFRLNQKISFLVGFFLSAIFLSA
jgi:hypothetical protein